MNKIIFKEAVTNNFSFLKTKYGFSEPVFEDLGREVYIRFNREDQTVSISYEFGSSPLIEIFYPSSETGDKPVPWASKNDVERSRRFSKIKTSIRFSDDEDVIKSYVKEMSLEFENIESNWLHIPVEK